MQESDICHNTDSAMQNQLKCEDLDYFQILYCVYIMFIDFELQIDWSILALLIITT